MKNYLLLLLSFYLFSYSFSADRYWISGLAGNWNNSANWSATNGGAGGASVPGVSDVAYFNNNGLGNCTVDIPVALGGLNTNNYTGTIDLNGNTFQVTSGNVDLRSGIISDGTSTITFIINTSGTANLRGATFNRPVNCTASSVWLSGSVYNDVATFTKTGGNNDNGTGGNTFNGNVTIVNSGTGYVLTGNNNPDIFNGQLTAINSGASVIYFAHNSAGNQFNQNILLEATSGNGIRFCQAGSGAATLAATMTISATGGGVTAGDHRIYNFTQSGSTAQVLNFTGTASLRIRGTNWGGNVSFTSPRLYLETSTFNGLVNATKTGAGDDNSIGGNTFIQNVSMTNSGSGDLGTGNGNPDDFQANLDLLNSGSNQIRIGINSAGNTIAGDLTYNQTGTTCRADFAENTASTIAITGNVDITCAGTDNSSFYFGRNGDITVGGNLTMTNNTSGASFTGVLANDGNSLVTINGTTTITNSPTGATTQRIYLGANGDMIFNNVLTITNASGANNSQFYLNNGATSFNQYNSNVIVNVTDVVCDGIFFGNSGGSGTLAAGQTITNGVAGYIAGDLLFRNFTQTGATAQSIALSGTARLYNYNSNWGGDVVFVAPRMLTRGTTYNGTAQLEKNGGVADDQSIGGNTFVGNTLLINSGSLYFMMGNGSADDFQANLEIQNSGSDQFYLAYNSAGNTIAGNLTIANSGTGNRIEVSDNTNSTLTVTGQTIVSNTSSADMTIVLGDNGDIDFDNQLTITNTSTAANSYIYVANGINSTVTVDGAFDLTINNGIANNSRSYIGNNGDVIFNSTIYARNYSGATNSDLYFNQGANSANSYNGNITLEVTDPNCDGIRFGNGGGVGTLAAALTINIGVAGYVAGDLQFRNFTQIGNTAQSLTCTGTARMYNYDSDWGGDVNFIAPRQLTRGTLYNRTARLEKSGANDDQSAGGNTFTLDATLVNSGSGYFMFGNGSLDNFLANVAIENTGSDDFYFAYNSNGNIIAGNLAVLNSNSATRVEFCDNANSTLTVGGNTTITNTSSGNATLMIGERGDITFTGDVILNDTGSGATDRFYFASGADASVFFSGNLDININTTASTETRSYLGNNGDITIDGTLDILNGSAATNSSIYLNYGAASTGLYNNNIILEVTQANCDGIRFGEAGGNGTLAATRTVGIGPSGFVAGDLRFRNFTQVGPTAQALTCTGTARILNQDSDWGGDITFIAPRIYTSGTLYNGTSYLEKNGATNDDSPGGNTFTGNAQLVNTGSGRLLFGNGTADTWQSNLDATNNGTSQLFIANTGVGHSIAGTLNWLQTGASTASYISNNTGSSLTVTSAATITNTSTVGGAVYIANNGTIDFGNNVNLNNSPTANGTGSSIISNGNNSIVNIAGVLTALNDGSAPTSRIYIGNNGDVNLSSSFNASNIGTGTNSYIYVANGTNSAVVIDGATSYSQSGAISRTRGFLGYNGDITFNGTLDVSNNATSTNSEVYLNDRANSVNTYNQNVTITSENASCDGVRFGQNGGVGTLSATRTVSVGAGGFVAGDLRFRNFNQLGGTAQNLICTGTARIYQHDSDWSGAVVFTAPRYYSRTTIYQSDATITKNGAGNDDSYGGNTFDGNTIFTHSGTSRWRMSNQGGNPNDHNGDVTYVKTGTGALEPARNNTDTYSGNLNFNTNTQLTMGVGGNGRVLMDGGIAQSINDLGASPPPRFRDLQINKSADDLTLNMPIEINVELDLDQGIIYSSTANLLYMRDNSIVSSVSNASHVDGPVEKIGNDAFVFPVGNGGNYAPCEITAPTNSGHSFRAQFFYTDPDPLYSTSVLDAGIDNVSRCEYWTVDRTNGTSNVSVTLSFEDVRSCGVTDPNELLVVRWDGSMWENNGNGGTTGNASAGTINTAAPVTNFSPFTLASTLITINPLPVELVHWDAFYVDSEVVLEWTTETEINNDYFVIERSTNGLDWEFLKEVDGAGNSNILIDYSEKDANPELGINYYRLKQIDFDGEEEIFDIKAVDIQTADEFEMYPNPTSGFVKITGVSFQLEDIKVYNSVGQKLMPEIWNTNGGIELDLSEFQDGTYYVHFNGSVKMLVKH